MIKKLSKKTTVLCLASSVLLMVMVVKVQALEPKLLWEKKLNFEITDIAFARNTGDIIVSGKYARKIVLFDKQGNLRFEWGPRIDRQPIGVDISADGRFFIYESSLTEKFKNKMNKSDWDQRVHFLNNKGKEFWNKKISYREFQISPNGDCILSIGVPSESGGIKLFDSSGRLLWSVTTPGIHGSGFSPDSKYIAVSDTGLKAYLFTKKGLVWEKDIGTYLVTSLSLNGAYISFSSYEQIKGGGKIVDKQGRVLLEGDNIAVVSGKGSKGVLWDKRGFRIYSLPDLTFLKTYPIVPAEDNIKNSIDISQDGRFIVVTGKKMDKQDINNVFLFDLSGGALWETNIIGEFIEVYLTSNGKHLLIKTGKPVPGSKGGLLYYQIY